MVKFKGRKCGCLPRGQEAAMLTLLLMSLLSLWRLWRSNAHSVLDDAAQPVRKFSWVAKDGIPVELALEEAEGDETDEDEDEEELEGELQEAKEPSEARPKHPERRAGAAGSSHAEEKTEGADKPCNMFTLWEYPNGAPEYVRLNVESWRRHSHGRCGEPIFLSDANIRKYIPDLPQEYFKLPYQACKSDVVRYAVIYHNGGIYMDTDFLVQEDLDPVIDLMDRDLISYSGMNPRGKECPADFSSNFLAGRKGSTFHKKVYDAQIEKMQKHCPASQKGKTVNGREVFCCFKEKDVKCDVPWAAIGEGVSHGVLRRMKADGEDFTSYCFAGDHSFVPFEMEGVLQHTPLLTDALERFEKNHVKNPLGRIAYHLFNSMTSLQTWSCKRLSNNDSFVGNLYVRSFTRGAGNKIVTGSAAQAFLEKYPQFKEQTRSQAMVPCFKKNPFAQLESMAPPAGPISDKCNIFSIAESDPSAAFDLNVDSWRRHTEELCNAPVMVNDSNVKSLLPDLPEEYFRLPGAQEKLDLIRHGLIYHHGGMVLQGDVVFLRDMSKVVQKIELHDLVSSSERRSGQATACGDSWQILFTAGKRGSRFHGAAWHFAKELVTKHCPLSDKEKEKVCCFDDKRLNCHIPGGALGESFSSRLKQEYEGDEQEMKSYCFSEAESFRPAMFQQVLDHTPAMDAGDKIFKREHKRSLLAGFALFVPLSMTRDVRCRQLFNTRKVIGAIYAASFDVSDESPELPCKQPQMIRSLLDALAPGNPSSEGKCFVFSLKLEPEPLAAKLNLASWRRHLPACEAVLISDSNVRDWVPDLPSEYFKLPGPEEKLDFLRHGLLFHNGGLVLRREIVAADSLAEILELAAKVDLLSSAEDRYGDSHECGGAFQSNIFLGGKRGSQYHGVTWSLTKEAVTKHCPLADRSKEIICCFDSDISCHIPGGSLGEGQSTRVKRLLEAGDVPVDSECLSEQRSIRPGYFQFVLDHKPKLADAEAFFRQERHSELMNRTAFFIPFSDAGQRSCEGFFETDTVVGAVYVKSFGPEICPLKSAS